jgi:uncharacterized membrane protein YgcG
MRILTRSSFTATLLVAAFGLAAAREAPPLPRPGGPGVAAPGAERNPLGPGQEEAIAEALQDEYRGEALYNRVLKTLGDVRPFSRVVHAETRHAAFLEDLLESRNLPLPPRAASTAEGPTYASRQEACAAGVAFEVQNVALYDRLLASGSLPQDVEAVFQHNRRASLDHHRPAFERCAGTGTASHAAGRRGGGCGRGGGSALRGGHGRGGGGGGGCGAGRIHGRCRRGVAPTAPAPAESGS